MKKRRILRNILIGIAVVITCVFVFTIILINTGMFRNFLRSEISKLALEHAGARVDVQSLAIHWNRLSVDLRNITVNGNRTSTPSEPPLFHAARLQVSLKFHPLLHRRIELNELIVDRPVLHLRIDAQGRSNLPVSPHPSNANSTNELFNLEVGDCAIRSGEIFYNNDETPLDAELHHLQFTARYRVLTSEYQGSLSYSEGSLAARDLGPIDNAMQVHFTASRSGISLSPLLLMTRASRIAVNAQLTNYQHPSIVASYDGSISTEAIAQVVRSQSVPVGIVTLNGKVAYQSAQSRPFIASVNANGKIRSADLQLRTGERPVSVSAVRATYNLANGNLSVQNVAANILGGTLHANWGIQHLDTTLHTSRINAILNGVSLKTLSDTLAPKNVQRIPFVGETNLNVNALWTGSIKNAVAHARLAISSRQSANPSHVIRVNGLVQVTYSGPQNTASFGQSYLRTLKTQVSISGTLSPKRAGRSALDIVANTSDLGEAGELAAIIQNAMTPSRKPPQIPALGGAAALTVHATGSLKAPHINGRITAQNLIVDSTRWHSLAVNINGSPSGVSVGNGVLTQAGNTQVKFAGSIGLRNWSPQASSAIQVHAAVKNLQLQMAEEITKLHYPIAGAASANLSVSGTKAAPRGKLELTILNASAWDQPVQKLTVNAQAETNVIQATMNLQIPAGNISARGSYSLSTEQYTAGLRGNGIKLQQISALEDRYPAKGTFDISASGHGPIRNSQIEAALTIPELQIRNQEITNISARLNVADKRAHVQFQAVADQGSVQATGNVALTGEYTATAQLDIYKLPIAAVAAKVLRGDSAPIGGQAEIHLKLSGPLKSPAQMQAQLEIPTLSVSYAKAQLALGRTLQADYRNGTLTINPTAIRGTGTNLTFGGTIPIKSEAAYSLAANGSVDMSVLQQFAPTVKSSGQIDLHIRSTGKLANPSMQGQLEIKNAVFTTETSPVGIEGVNALINLSGRRADIADFSGTVGGGTVSARGFAIFGPKGSFDVVLNASGIRMLYPQGLRSDLSAQITFAGDTASSTLSGRVLVNHLSFTQQFDLASLTGDFSEESGSGTPSPFENSVKLNVAVQSSEPINLANRQLSFAGSANLNVIGTLANPVILGRIAVTGGDVFFLSKRFQFQNGTIAFANPARTEPVLSMYITTTVEQYNVTLNLSGPVDRLKVNYTSDPALAPADIIHLLAFGNTTAEAAAQPSQSAAIGAESVLAQGVGSQVAGKLQNLAGISQITIDPLATNNSGDPGSQIALQERITGSLLFTFSTNVTTTQGQTVELQYQLNPRISITAIRDQNGGYALDLRWHKVF